MEQTLVNWFLAGFGGVIGFLLKSVWESVKELQHADKELAAKVGEIEVLVAGAYVRKEELVKINEAIFTKLERIEYKLDGKADKR